jgi:holo-[acyl-carrier protein] synthase
MIYGIGCDIVEIARLKEILIHKILSVPEMALYESFSAEKRRQEFLAGRFALKEAIVKAVGPIPFPELVILNDESGKPYVVCPQLDHLKVNVSLAHEKAYAVAFCVAEKRAL